MHSRHNFQISVLVGNFAINGRWSYTCNSPSGTLYLLGLFAAERAREWGVRILFPSVTYPDHINSVARSFSKAVAASPEDHFWPPVTQTGDDNLDNSECVQP